MTVCERRDPSPRNRARGDAEKKNKPESEGDPRPNVWWAATPAALRRLSPTAFVETQGETAEYDRREASR